MAEPVRLVIWDLDETFWNGTLTEGGIEFVERHKEAVVRLAERGIVSSICSRNDFETVKRILVERGVWDYFVLPSIDWEAKGPRVRDLIETIGLRAAAVMFIDDNPFNLEEARRFCPDIQTRGPEAIAQMLEDPLFAGKDDRELTRLQQYKALELRRTESRAAAADPVQFLRDSAIEVEIELDVEAHIDRFIELINRTNQLNFTKRRLPEDPEAAREEVREICRRWNFQLGLVRVRDKYGDHGFCGAYQHSSEGRRLDQFAFSCRILGLGVERWLYQKLGRPLIAIKGEVLADLADPSPVDWINQGPAGRVGGQARRIGRVTARGSCEIGAVVHYLRYHTEDAAGEYHLFREGGVFRIGHSVFFHHGAVGLTPAQKEAAKSIGYRESDFSTRLFDPQLYDARGHLVLLGFGVDAIFPLIRHRASGLIVPFPAMVEGWGARDLSKIPESEEPADYPAWARAALARVRAEWDWLGYIKPSDFEALVRFAVARIPNSAQIRLLTLPSRPYLHADGRMRHAPPEFEEFNAGLRRVAADHPHVVAIELDDVLEAGEMIDRLHYSRPAYFRIYQRICATLWPEGSRVA